VARVVHRIANMRALAWLPTLAVVMLSADVTPAADCKAWQIDYTLAATLTLSDTPMGAGDGEYAIGPGQMTLRFEDKGGKPGGRAQMLAYKMRDHFTVVSRALFLKTTVTTDARTRVTPVAGVAAEGRLEGGRLDWTTKVRGYRTDGYLTCEGALCGKFGAPPAGRSELRIGPGDVQFSALQLSADLKRFTMPSTFVAKTKTPKQTAHVELRGREARRRAIACPSTF
jgi:hypothetical protein